MGWKCDAMDVDIMFCSSQLIHVLVITRNEKPFYCSFVYSANEKKERLLLFQHLQNIACNIDKPWLVGGDFNCVANINKHIGSVLRNSSFAELYDAVKYL